MSTLIFLGYWIDYKLGQQFAKDGHGIPEGPQDSFRGLPGQNYFHNKDNMLFAFYTLIPLHIFQRLYNDVIPLRTIGICASVFLYFKTSNMETSVWGKME